MTGKFTFDGDAVKKLAEILRDTDLSEIEYEDEGRKIRVARQVTLPQAVVAPHAIAAPTAPAMPPPLEPHKAISPENHPGAIKSPMVGTTYMSPEPGAQPFVSEGSTVKEGQTLMIIEAMKVMNPIKSPRAGVITKIFAKDSMPVEFGQTLLILE